ncbi:hypothetical protein Tco_0434606 [Tanacetum coccineum]
MFDETQVSVNDAKLFDTNDLHGYEGEEEKHFAALRAQEKRNRPPTKAQKRNQMSVYLKHMGGYKHNQLKGRSYDEIQKLFDKEMKRVNSFVAMIYRSTRNKGIDREDLETLWKLVKIKHGDTRPEDEHERVLWG